MGKTNCGEPITCNKCSMFCTWCLECQLWTARLEIQRLKSENAFLRKEQDKQLIVTSDLFYRKGGRKHLETPYTTPMNQDNLYFLTITFDPNRFDGLGNDTAAEEDYICHQIALATKDQLIIQLVGCFELQNNGTTHLHAHVRTYQPIELKKMLKRQFTNNMRNQKCIDLQPAKKSEKGMDYINKLEEGKGTENKSWITINSLSIELDREAGPGRDTLYQDPQREARCSEAGECFDRGGEADEINKLTKINTIPKTIKKILKKNPNLIKFI